MSQPNFKNYCLWNIEVLIYSLLMTFILTWQLSTETKKKKITNELQRLYFRL